MKKYTASLLSLVLSLSLYSLAGKAQQTWCGLWNSSMGLEARRSIAYDAFDQYVRFTAQNSKQLVGSKAHAVRFWIYDKTEINTATLWISTSYPLQTTNTLFEISIESSELKDFLHDNEPTIITLDSEQDLLPSGNPYASCFVGLSIQKNGSSNYTQLASADAGMALSNMYNGTDVSAQYGALPIQVLASGNNISGNIVQPQPMGELITIKNSETTLSVNAINQCAGSLSNIAYVLSINGNKMEEQHYDLPKTVDEMGATFTLPVSFIAPAETKDMEMSITITKVNGNSMADDNDVLSASGRIIVLDQLTTKRAVMEEFTGTWCHNCVRGFVGINILSQQFGNQFIPIAVHGDERDPMMIDSYYRSDFFREKMRKLGGYPSCTIDRFYDCDPYCGYNVTGSFLTDAIVEEALTRLSPADISVEGLWANDEQTMVAFDVRTRFGYSSETSNYSLVLILTADGLEGPGRTWEQSNGYNSYTGTDEALLEYVGKGTYIKNMKYNHVAIAVEGVDGGIDGSIKTPLVAGEEQLYSFSLDVEDNELVQDKDQLNVVAMLIDTRNGTVVNAATSHVSAQTGITSASTQGEQTKTIFDIQGRRVANASQPGIYIMNGKKVVVR